MLSLGEMRHLLSSSDKILLPASRSMSFRAILQSMNFPSQVARQPPPKRIPRRNPIKATTSAADQKPIVIPKKIQRDELTVLKALAGTVEKDLSSPHHMFQDDPYLLPLNNLEKKSFALAKASGRRAAKYVIETCPQPFLHNPAQPGGQAFLPPTGLKFAVDTLEGLRERIQCTLPVEAYDSYEKLKAKKKKIPDEDMLALLHIVAYYNNQNPAPQSEPEEAFVEREVSGMVSKEEKKVKPQSVGTTAGELIFKDIKNPNTLAYGLLIEGLAKNGMVDKAMQYFQEAKEKNVAVDVRAYNAILSIANFVKDSNEDRWNYIIELLTEMNSAQVQPNLQTFNTVLYSLSRMARFSRSPGLALMTFREMIKVGIEPTLGTFMWLVKIVYTNTNARSEVLKEIVELLEKRPKLEATEAIDYEFFSLAMSKCLENVEDLSLGYRIDKLVRKNFHLLGDSFKQSIYFSSYIKLLCLFEQLDKVMDEYYRIVPHNFVPTYNTLDELLKALSIGEGYTYMPKIWSDILMFEYGRRPDVIGPVFEIMAYKAQPEDLQAMFIKAAEQCMTIFVEDRQSTKMVNPLQFSCPLLSNLILICLNGNQFDKAWSFYQLYLEHKSAMTGTLSSKTMAKLSDICIQAKNVKQSIDVLEGLSDFSLPELDSVAMRVKKELPLTPEQVKYVNSLL